MGTSIILCIYKSGQIHDYRLMIQYKYILNGWTTYEIHADVIKCIANFSFWLIYAYSVKHSSLIENQTETYMSNKIVIIMLSGDEVKKEKKITA